MSEQNSKSLKIALIGLVSTLGVALFANWDKVFPPQPSTSTPQPSTSTPQPSTSTQQPSTSTQQPSTSTQQPQNSGTTQVQSGTGNSQVNGNNNSITNNNSVTNNNSESKTPDKKSESDNSISEKDSQLSQTRSKVSIQYYARDADPQAVKNNIQRLNFQVSVIPSKKSDPTDTIWYGTPVQIEDVKSLARVLLDSGVNIRSIRPFYINSSHKNKYLIQIGSAAEDYDPTGKYGYYDEDEKKSYSDDDCPVWTIEDIEAASEFTKEKNGCKQTISQSPN
jgi:hypothetical protein